MTAPHHRPPAAPFRRLALALLLAAGLPGWMPAADSAPSNPPPASAVQPSSPTPPPPVVTAFQAGIDAYLVSDFEAAADQFQKAVAESPSAGAWHNLGNAEWQRGKTGPAILAWERAAWLDPFNPNPRANLRAARKSAQIDTPDLSWHELCSTWLPVDAWAWVAAFSFWLAVALMLLPNLLHWRRADWRQGLAAAGLAVFLLTLPALAGVQSRSRIGIVVNPDTPLRLTPTQEAQTLAKIPAGAMARLERRRGDYVYVRTQFDSAGWLKQSDFGLISQR
jgi:tetratricopeptide (TPR) repeat protein